MRNGVLRLGILGAARIALGGIIPAAGRAEGVEVAAVATRGGEKGVAVRELVPDASVFDDYDSLLESAEVDAVYVPLPNSMHVEWTLKALEAGKHVLCEKPFSLEADGARRAVEAARGRNLALMEGFMYRFHPQTARVAEILRSGAIGGIRQAVAEFGHRLDDPEDVRGVGSLGGGSLGDVGCYCVSGLRLAFGSEPVRATAFGFFDEEGADRDLGGVLQFEGGVGIISCSISSSRRERLEITGTDGRISLSAPFRADKAGGELDARYGTDLEAESFGSGDPYAKELEEFARAVREGRDPAVGPDEILGNARALDALLRSARSGGTPQKV
ncbi:gfo/Idh/MocA family oxidoreductase [Rubrobacter marinus]|uniref:Gfo/Idh/MocA family oxidoreductase n=1 Tax=Rubrobacter marinus TaxID=2653852 RepID=A0A6G8PV01_9ACTN|nr:Gfo/Idh/MocA family oxidoreductase [Rubrobacter marinus]QIN78031.1 gfo/Idh/MocA family oxidoreductase [Rubrobacter marinus]